MPSYTRRWRKILDSPHLPRPYGSSRRRRSLTIDFHGPRCTCGKLGCIEALASGPAIARRAAEKIAAGRQSALAELAGGHLAALTGEMVGRAYAAGDFLAKEILEETAMFVAVWLGNVLDLVEPDAVIIGGGAASLLQPFFAEIRHSVNPRVNEIPLLPVHYGADAGIAGAAALCLESGGDNS